MMKMSFDEKLKETNIKRSKLTNYIFDFVAINCGYASKLYEIFSKEKRDIIGICEATIIYLYDNKLYKFDKRADKLYEKFKKYKFDTLFKFENPETGKSETGSIGDALDICHSIYEFDHFDQFNFSRLSNIDTICEKCDNKDVKILRLGFDIEIY